MIRVDGTDRARVAETSNRSLLIKLFLIMRHKQTALVGERRPEAASFCFSGPVPVALLRILYTLMDTGSAKDLFLHVGLNNEYVWFLCSYERAG